MKASDHKRLLPVSPPLSLFNGMTARETETLVINKEQLHDNFDIETTDGKACLRIKAKPDAVHDCKHIVVDATSDAHLFDIAPKIPGRRTAFVIKDESDKIIMEVRQSRFSCKCMTLWQR